MFLCAAPFGALYQTFPSPVMQTVTFEAVFVSRVSKGTTYYLCYVVRGGFKRGNPRMNCTNTDFDSFHNLLPYICQNSP